MEKTVKYFRIVFVLFVLFCPVFSYSQLGVGMHIGNTFGNAKIEEKYWIKTFEFDAQTKNGLSYGGFFETRLYSFLFIQSEVNYIGHRISTNDDVSYYLDGGKLMAPTDISLKYIEIPVLLKIKKEYNGLIPYFFAGVGLSFLKSQKNYHPYNYYSNSTLAYYYSQTYQISDNQSFVLLGLGSEYNLYKNINLFLTLRYSSSLQDVEKSEKFLFKPYNFDILFGIKTILFHY